MENLSSVLYSYKIRVSKLFPWKLVVHEISLKVMVGCAPNIYLKGFSQTEERMFQSPFGIDWNKARAEFDYWISNSKYRISRVLIPSHIQCAL